MPDVPTSVASDGKMPGELPRRPVSELLFRSILDSETLNASVSICSSSGDSGESCSWGFNFKTVDEDELSVELPLVPCVEHSEIIFVYIFGKYCRNLENSKKCV